MIAAALAAPAWAGEVACRFDEGVIVVPAEVAGIAGDYILDTGSAQTTLHETKAQTEGIEATELVGRVRLAGAEIEDQALKVADLDVRTWNLPSAVIGLIGADVLKGFVLDVAFAPCKVRLSHPGAAPPFRGRALALDRDTGRPTATASVSDDTHVVTGAFVIATGSSAPVRLADDLAQTNVGTPQELYPQGLWFARLPQVTFAGRTGRDVAAGLMKPEGDVVGILGGPVLARFRLRFDFPAGRLTVAPAR